MAGWSKWCCTPNGRARYRGPRRSDPGRRVRVEQHRREHAVGVVFKTVTDAKPGDGFDEVGDEDPTSGGRPIVFPRIQGADVCGEIIAVGTDIDPARIGDG